MIILAVIFLLLGITAAAQAQQPNKIYVDTNGKIYVNLHQPYYFKVSPSPDPNSDKTLLTTSTTPEIVNPLYFGHEGANVLYTPWAIDTATRKPIYPKQNVEFIVYADGTAPRSKLIFSNNYITKQNKKFFGSDLQIQIVSKDNLSGVYSIYYSVDSSDFKKFTGPLSFSEQKFYTLRYYAIDNVGNTEKIKTFEFYIDTSAPHTQLLIEGLYVKNILSPGAKINLDFADNLSGIKATYYSIDDGDTLLYRGPIPVAFLPEGWHTLRYFSKDLVGNTENPRTYKFFLDKTPPLILEDIIGTSYFVGNTQYLSANSKLKLTAIDNFAGVKAIYYSFDGKNWQKYTGPIPFPKTEKLITLKYYAVDSVGNKSVVDETLAQKGGTFSTYIDLEPPRISYSFIDVYRLGDTVFMGKNSRIKLTATDNKSGIKEINYQIDTSSPVVYEQPFTLEQPGLHKITATAFDNVNNFTITDFVVKVDTTAPVAELHFSVGPRFREQGLAHYPPNVKVFVTAKDNMTGVNYLAVSVNGSPYAPNKTYLYGFSPGKVTVKVKVSDYLGNVKVRVFEFYVEKN